MTGTRRVTSTNPRLHTPRGCGLQAEYNQVVARLATQVPRGDFCKPLAFWTVPSDRRLPYALLDRTVNELIEFPFEKVLAIPGIGPRKAASLIALFRRVVDQQAASQLSSDTGSTNTISFHDDGIDASCICETTWESWRATVRRHSLEAEKLGRFAPTLQGLPRVVWQKRLADYLDFSMEEIRSLKTHGDKRVQAVLEVFYEIHRTLSSAPGGMQLTVRLAPAFVPPLEQWIWTALASSEPITFQELRQQLVLPLLNQIQCDTDEPIHRLAAGRLGVEGAPENVRDQARELDVTRARIYQMLEVCGEVMDVRWPEGSWLLQLLLQKLEAAPEDSEAVALLKSLQQLLYAQRTRVPETEPAVL